DLTSEPHKGGYRMSSVSTIEKIGKRKQHKRKPKTKPDAPGAGALASIDNDNVAVPIENGSTDFVWGAAGIGGVLCVSQAKCFHLIYTGALDGAVKKVNGQWVGNVEKLKALLP